MRRHGRVGDHNTRSQSALLVTECRAEVCQHDSPAFQGSTHPLPTTQRIGLNALGSIIASQSLSGSDDP